MGFPLALCWVHTGERRGKASGGLLIEILMDTRCKNKQTKVMFVKLLLLSFPIRARKNSKWQNHVFKKGDAIGLAIL